MSDEPLIAHSLAEARFYLMVTPCSFCGRGPLNDDEPRPLERSEGGAALTIEATCGACGSVAAYAFCLPGDVDDKPPKEPADQEINPTGDPSRILDVGQWIVLYRMLVEAADGEPDRFHARRLGLQAAQCLGEALKFYDVGNDLPPEEALFVEASRQRLREAPEQFSRQRLIELRAKLPSVSARRSRRTASGQAPWWRRWLRAHRRSIGEGQRGES